MIYDSIKDFPSQFTFVPTIENEKPEINQSKFVVSGMGGSNLASQLIKNWKPEINLTTHKDYGLPVEAKDREHLIICSSYSGNTEETVDSYNLALKNNLPLIVITSGGKLLELAKENKTPLIKIPSTNIQPRAALGLSFRAILKAIGDERGLQDSEVVYKRLQKRNYETLGQELAERIYGFLPVIYTSNRNAGIGYNWKIKLNETGKIPAFHNVLPEMNHNEMNGFDSREKSKHLSDKFYFIFIWDDEDHERIIRRMEVLGNLYQMKNYKVETIGLSGENRLIRIFSNLLRADWTAYHTAQLYDHEATQVPMVEEFKRLI